MKLFIMYLLLLSEHWISTAYTRRMGEFASDYRYCNYIVKKVYHTRWH